MYNKVALMGRICTELELKNTLTGTPVISFRIAVDRNYQSKGEERKTDFFNIVAWRSTAEFIFKYFDKGRMIMVDGELQTRQYINKNDITVDVTEIIANSVHFTGEKKDDVGTRSPQSGSGYQPQGGNYQGGGGGYQPQQGGTAANNSGYPQGVVVTGNPDEDYPF